MVTGVFDEGFMKNVDVMAAGPASFCLGKPIIPQCVRIPNNHPSICVHAAFVRVRRCHVPGHVPCICTLMFSSCSKALVTLDSWVSVKTRQLCSAVKRRTKGTCPAMWRIYACTFCAISLAFSYTESGHADLPLRVVMYSVLRVQFRGHSVS